MKARRLGAAVAVELRKAAASRVPLATAALVTLGTAALVTSLSLAADAGNQQVLAQLGDLAGAHGWARTTGVAAQIVSAGGALALGIVLSWLVGREFADRTVGALFALPVPRASTALAKLVVHAAFTVGLAVATPAALAVVGLAIGDGVPDAGAWQDLGRLAALILLTGAVVVPAGWVATLGRGLLSGVAATIGIVVVAQVAVVAGTGAWFPFAAPALWAMGMTTAVAPLGVTLAVAAVFAALTMRSWRRLQLDR
ncbi:hypothetical protein Bcav_0255 [Beutenbergia cavernae DSM 12333]|uniref:ABC-2 type transport system permease protein n=1 Tax=Beutenbergia cavernae (strain ATCC BAA-8 / DSM 12333 / CCUG 43141 / JCM 11478 / NBRC 16432 / NCIMB 13614 / HKI 0122) TaxID=471853 RepID=C5BVT0_BEUC1|nr:ABC transporter permease [Beutenbergia cavernae]ACQ78520.1 hypothetical protein Bcav_0255 [Beutenbergia cavernae DSM 12333]